MPNAETKMLIKKKPEPLYGYQLRLENAFHVAIEGMSRTELVRWRRRMEFASAATLQQLCCAHWIVRNDRGGNGKSLGYSCEG